MATLSIANVLDVLAGREETSISIRQVMQKQSAVARFVNPTPMSNGVLAYSTLDDAQFYTWDNASSKTAQNLSGAVGEVTAKTIYAIVAYPNNYEADLDAFPQQFSTSIANGLAKHLDNTILNGSAGVITAASGCGQVVSTTSGTTYALYTDLVNTAQKVVASGWEPNGIISARSEYGNILNSVSTIGLPIFSQTANELIGLPHARSWVTLDKSARFVVGDWTKVVWGVYENLKFEKFTSGIVTIGGVDHNLIQENLIAVRVEARMAFAVTQGCAFAYLKS